MPQSIELTLSVPKSWNGKPVDKLQIQEPTGLMYGRLGEPRLLIRNADGAAYHVEQPSVVWAYVEGCVQHEGGQDVVKQLDLVDIMKIKKTIFGFFTKAEAIVYAT